MYTRKRSFWLLHCHKGLPQQVAEYVWFGRVLRQMPSWFNPKRDKLIGVFLCTIVFCIKSQEMKSLIYVSIQALYSVLCRSSFGSNYRFKTQQALHTWICAAHPILSGSFSHGLWMGSVCNNSIGSFSWCYVGVLSLSFYWASHSHQAFGHRGLSESLVLFL